MRGDGCLTDVLTQARLACAATAKNKNQETLQSHSLYVEARARGVSKRLKSNQNQSVARALFLAEPIPILHVDFAIKANRSVTVLP